jgi:hypothetical protein
VSNRTAEFTEQRTIATPPATANRSSNSLQVK